MSEASRDQNHVPTALGVSSVDSVTPTPFVVNPVTGRLLTDVSGGGSGTVTSVSVVSANGFAGTVATATTTPAITLTTTITGILKGNGTAISAATDGTDYLSSTTGLKLDQTSAQTITNDTPIFNTLTASELVATTAAKKLQSLAVATYPSLTEISYVKGVTSSLQTQLDAKQATITFGTGVQTALGVNVGTAGSIVVNGDALGTPSSGTVTNLTGTASININGTVGATTPTTATFTTATINTGVVPDANDGAYLGQSGTAFSDLFLASGGVINWDAGNMVLTHSSGILDVTTGDLRVTTAGTNAASVVTVGGTQTLTNKTLTSAVLGTGVSGTALADASGVNTGTSTTTLVTPDSLAGSYAGTKSLSVQVFDGTTDVTTGDGKAYITIPESLNGMNLVRAQATVVTAGTTNATTVMVHNKTDAQDMLSGAISIASGGTVGTVGTINTTYDDVATNDVLRIDVDSVSTTAPKGLMVVLEFRLA